MKKKEKISLEKAKVLSILNSSKPIFENYIIQGYDFTGRNLSAMTFTNCEFIDCSFTGCDFSKMIIHTCDFNNCSFDNVKALNTLLYYCEFHGICFNEACFSGAKFSNCFFYSTDFSNSQFPLVGFLFCNFFGNINFSDADLSNSEFCCCTKEDNKTICFENARIKDLKFSNCNFSVRYAINGFVVALLHNKGRENDEYDA